MALTDLIELSTVVNAVAGNTITLGSVAGLAVGDKIIIESQHGYNETGLDGDWAITLPTTTNYYLNVSHIGKSFLGTVSAISGNVVTVDRAVPAGAVGLPCYRNNADAIEYAVNNRIAWPASKVFAFATSNTRALRCYTTSDQYTYDFNNCEIFAPKGCGPAILSVASSLGGPTSNKIYKNLTIRGNVRLSGYGISAETGVYIQGSSFSPAFSLSGTGGPGGSYTSNQHVENFKFIDNWQSLAIQLATDCTATGCRSEFTAPLKGYVQWEYQAASAERITFTDCVVDSDYVRAGFEPFKCYDVTFTRCGGRNTGFSCNSSGTVLFDSCWVEWDDVDPDPSWSPYNPLMNLNRIIEEQQGSPVSNAVGGVLVLDFDVTYNAAPYVGQIFNTISINPGYHGIPTGAVIRRLTLTAPGGSVTPNQGYAVRSDESGTVFSGYLGVTLPGHAYVLVGVPTAPAIEYVSTQSRFRVDCETVLVDDDGVEILLEAPYDVFVDDDGVVIVDDDGVELMKEDTELVTPSDIAVCAKRRSVVAAGMVRQMRIDVVRPAGAKGCGCEDV